MNLFLLIRDLHPDQYDCKIVLLRNTVIVVVGLTYEETLIKIDILINLNYSIEFTF
jgi:hypothetical protein